MVGLVRGVLNCRIDIFSFEKRVVFKDLFEKRTVGEQLKNVADANTLSANAGAPSALFIFDGDSFQSVKVH